MKARFSDCPRQGKRRSGVLESEIGPKPPLSPPFPVGPSLAYQGDTVARSWNDEREAGERLDLVVFLVVVAVLVLLLLLRTVLLVTRRVLAHDHAVGLGVLKILTQ